MKIRFREEYKTDAKTYAKGSEHDVPEPRASMYVKSGVAEQVKPADATAPTDSPKPK